MKPQPFQFLREISGLGRRGPHGGLLNAAGSGSRRWRRRGHQAKSLKQEDGALRCAAPDQLAAFTLAVLHVNVAAGVFQAAVPERAIDIDTVIQRQMLVFKNLAFVAGHSAHEFGAIQSSKIGRFCRAGGVSLNANEDT